MRDIQSGKYHGRQRRKKKSGCCLGRLLTLLVIFGIIGVIGYKTFQSMGLKNYILQARYPIKYQALVEEYSEEFELDDTLVYAIIHTESKFDPYAVSSADAKGLMQLRDETAIDCAKSLKIKNFIPDQLFEPAINIRLGCCYLNKLIKRYNGNLENAVAAYNGGPGNVDAWLKNDKYSNGNDGLSYIPFTETRNYVKKVMEAQRRYTELYNLN